MSEQTEMRIKMKTLVLAEKPSVGRDIGRVLHCTPQGNGFLEGKDYIVTWGLGHLVTLKDPEGYDKKYKDQPLSHHQLPASQVPREAYLYNIFSGCCLCPYKAFYQVFR